MGAGVGLVGGGAPAYLLVGACHGLRESKAASGRGGVSASSSRSQPGRQRLFFFHVTSPLADVALLFICIPIIYCAPAQSTFWQVAYYTIRKTSAEGEQAAGASHAAAAGSHDGAGPALAGAY